MLAGRARERRALAAILVIAVCSGCTVIVPSVWGNSAATYNESLERPHRPAVAASAEEYAACLTKRRGEYARATAMPDLDDRGRALRALPVCDGRPASAPAVSASEVAAPRGYPRSVGQRVAAGVLIGLTLDLFVSLALLAYVVESGPY